MRKVVKKSPDFGLDEIFKQIESHCLAEYERGSREMFGRLALIANKQGKGLVAANLQSKRAPKGAATALVEKALETGPKTIKEIMDSAESGLERSLSYQVIRLALERGKSKKMYKKTKDKWSKV